MIRDGPFFFIGGRGWKMLTCIVCRGCKHGNKLYAREKKFLQEDGNTQKNCLLQEPHTKIMFACENLSTLPPPPPPSKKEWSVPDVMHSQTLHSKLRSFNKITCAYMWASIILYACRDPTSPMKSQRAGRRPKKRDKTRTC